MPDDEDFAELARLLADPASWTRRERLTMQLVLREQTAQLTAAHPRDVNRRTRLQDLVDRVDAAIRASESTGPAEADVD